MDTFLIILAGVLLLVSLVGNILPAIPGTPLGYIGLLIMHFTDKAEFSLAFLIIWGVVVVIVQVLDYVVPVYGTKRFGGSEYGTRGSTAGLVVGMFLGPLGIIFGPFIGAVIGEKLGGQEWKDAFRSGFGSFIGFLAGTAIKVICSLGMIACYIIELVWK